MDRGAWRTTVHEVTDSHTLTYTHTHTPKEPKSHGQRSLVDYSP